MATDREQWVLTLEAADDGPPPVEVRVRALLKAALRRWRLRCVRVSGPVEDKHDGMEERPTR